MGKPWGEGEAQAGFADVSGAVAPTTAARSDLLAAARRWIGTPYLHQTATCGAGADCLGLIRGLWREFALTEPERAPPYTPDWSEAGGDERLWNAALRHLIPTRTIKSGTVLLFRMRRGAVAKHLGLAAEIGAQGPASFIHAYSGQGVVESSFSALWQRHLVAGFEFPWISD